MPYGHALPLPAICIGAALARPVGPEQASRLGVVLKRPRGRGLKRPWIALALLLSFPAPAVQPGGLPGNWFSEPSFIAAVQLPGMVWRRPVTQPAASPLPRSAADDMTDRYLDWQGSLKKVKHLWARAMSLPTPDEMDDVYRSIYHMKKQLRRHEKTIQRQEERISQLLRQQKTAKKPASKSRSKGAAKASKTRKSDQNGGQP